MFIPLFTAGFSMLVVLIGVAMTGKTVAIVFLCLAAFVLLVDSLALRIISKENSVGKNTQNFDQNTNSFATNKTNKIHYLREYKRVCLTVGICAVSVILASSNYLIREHFFYEPTVALCSDESYMVTARVLKVEYKDEGPDKFVLEVIGLESSQKSFKVLLTSNKLRANIGDVISFKSKLKPLGEGEMTNYYKSQGIYVGAYSYKPTYVSFANEGTQSVKIMLLQFAENVRTKVRNSLCRFLPDNYAYVALGMLIGDKSRVEEETLNLFKSVGIIHLFSVSGFHISFFSALIFRELLKHNFNQKFSCFLTIIFIALFCIVTGLSKSTIRASLMLIVFYVGRMITKDADSLNSLGLSAVVILMANPYAGGDFGFLLSFFATLGILSSQKSLMRPADGFSLRIGNIRVRERFKSACGTLAVSLCAFTFTLPLSVVFSDSVALVSPLSNLLIVFAAETAILFSAFGVLLSLLRPVDFLCYPVFFVAGQCLRYLLGSARLLTNLPFYSADISPSYIKITLAAVLTLFAFSYLIPLNGDRRHARARFTFLLSIIIVLGAVLFNLIFTGFA